METLPLEVDKACPSRDLSGQEIEQFRQWAAFLIFSSSIARFDS